MLVAYMVQLLSVHLPPIWTWYRIKCLFAARRVESLLEEHTQMCSRLSKVVRKIYMLPMVPHL
jgi:hypothetical protein